MSSRIRFIAAFVGVSFLAWVSAAPAADFVYTSQSRWAIASINGPGADGNASQQLAAPDFDPFNVSAHANVSPFFAYATQTQNSQLLPTSIITAGSFSGAQPFNGIANGLTITDIAFSVATSTEVELTALIAISSDPGIYGNRVVRLTGPNTNINWTIRPPSWTGTRSATTILEPGQYQFLVDLNTFMGVPGTGVSSVVYSYDVQLNQVPEPASLVVLLMALPILASRRRCNSIVDSNLTKSKPALDC